VATGIGIKFTYYFIF